MDREPAFAESGAGAVERGEVKDFKVSRRRAKAKQEQEAEGAPS